MSTSILKALPGTLDIKKYSPSILHSQDTFSVGLIAFNPFHPDGFFHTCLLNKYEIAHFVFQGITGRNF